MAQKKVLDLPLVVRRAIVGEKSEPFSHRQRCEWLGVNRSGCYYQARPESAENLLYMRLLDEQYTEDPTSGEERMTAYLQRLGHGVGRKRARRLWRKMGLEARYQKPDTSQANPGHTVFPYLLRDVTAAYRDHVWSTDIAPISGWRKDSST